MFRVKAYCCVGFSKGRMKKQPRADLNNHIVIKENLHCRTTTSTYGRRWRDFTGSLKPSKDSLLKRKSDCQQNLSSISSQEKKKKYVTNFACTKLYEPSFQKERTTERNKLFDKSCLFPELYEPSFQIRKNNRAKSIFCQPCIACHSLLWEIVIKQRCPMPLKLFSPTTAKISEDFYNREKKRMCAWLPR